MHDSVRVDVFVKPQTNPFNLSIDAVLIVYTERKLTRENCNILLNGIVANVPYDARCHPMAYNLRLPSTGDKSTQYLRVTLHCGAASYDILHEYVRRLDEALTNPTKVAEIADRPYIPRNS